MNFESIINKKLSLNFLLNKDFILILFIFFYFLFPYIFSELDTSQKPALIPKEYENALTSLSLIGYLNIFIHYLTTYVIGHIVFRSLYKNNEPLIINFLASFSLGYLSLLPVFRLLSFYFENIYIHEAMPFLLILLLLRYFPKIGKLKLSAIDSSQVVLVLTSVVVLFSGVYLSTNYWMGDPDVYTPFLVSLKSKIEFFPFPLIKIHYDQTLYNYAIFMSPDVNLHPAVLHWLTNSLIKISFLCSVYVFFRVEENSKINSIIYSLFLVFGTFSMNFFHYFLYFDSFNPIAKVLHAGRIIGPYTGICLTYFVMRNREFSIKNNLMLSIIGMGLMMGPAHNSVLIIFLLLVQIIFFKYQFDFSKINREQICIVFLISFFMAYASYSYRNIYPGIFIYLAFITTSLLGFSLLEFRVIKGNFHLENSILPVLFLAWGVYISAQFFGNIFINSTEAIDPFQKDGYMVKFDFHNFFVNAQMNSAGTSINKPWSKYDLGGINFIEYYFIFPLFSSFAFYSKSIRSFKTELNLKNIIFSISLIYFFLFYMDFVNDIPNLNWVKSRLLEIPVYIFFFYFLLELKNISSRLKLLTLIILLGNTIGPIYFYSIVPQTLFNIKFILSQVGIFDFFN